MRAHHEGEHVAAGLAGHAAVGDLGTGGENSGVRVSQEHENAFAAQHDKEKTTQQQQQQEEEDDEEEEEEEQEA